VCSEMHMGGVEPDKKWFVGINGTVDKIQACCKELFINGLHALAGQCTGIFNSAVSIGVDDPLQH